MAAPTAVTTAQLNKILERNSLFESQKMKVKRIRKATPY